MKQSTFLHEIDRKQTKEAVEHVFELYRLYKYLDDIEPSTVPRQPDTDADLIRGSGVSSSTESIAVQNVDRKEFIQRVDFSVRKLSKNERTIMEQLYMVDDPSYDINIMQELRCSRDKYYKTKSVAYYKLALALRVAVFIRNDTTEEVR